MTLRSLSLPRRVGLGAAAALAAVVLVLVTWGIAALAMPDPAGGDYAALTYGPGGDIQIDASTSASCGLGQLEPGRTIASSFDCAEPHDLEVFGAAGYSFSSDVDIRYPGEEALAAYVRAYCAVLFDSEYITGDDKADLAVTVLVPAEEGWAGTGDDPGLTSSLCVLSRADTQLNGSRVRADS